MTDKAENIVDLVVHPLEYQCIPSDHHLITFNTCYKITTTISVTKDREVFDYAKGDYVGLNEYLLGCDLTDLYNSSDTEEIWNILKRHILTGMNRFIPKVKLRSRQFPVWFTPHLRHLIKCLRTLQRKYTKNPTTNNFQRLVFAQCSFQDTSRAAKSVYEQNLIQNYATNHDPKIYQYIKQYTKSCALPPQLHLENNVANTDNEKAKLFNQYFFSVFTKSNFQVPHLDGLNPSANSLETVHLTESDVFGAIVNLNPHKATGIDLIAPRILKSCACTLSLPLLHLFTTSLNTSSIPYEWKIHKIIPVYKSKDKTSVTNYRPISLLCNVSKVFERLIYDKVISTVANLITPHQFGFQKGHSTLQQLLLFFHQLITSNDEIDVIYVDFRKAFDSVPHNELLVKLWNMGITGTLWKWFESYLSNRSQCVSINNSLSDCLPVLSGVPQGSILGPLLFLVYINDLPSVISSSNTFIFADDTKCFKIIKTESDIQLLQNDLTSLAHWSDNNHLSFNISKFVLLRLHNKFNSEYTIHGNAIPHSSSCKDLGINLSDNLSWRLHYQTITSKAYKSLGLLRRIFNDTYCPLARKNLYISIIRSTLLYCSCLWKPYLLSDIELIEKVQKRATKYILCDYTSDYKSRLMRLNLLPLMYIYDLYDIMFFINSVKSPSDKFNILDYVEFTFGTTRSAGLKLKHKSAPTNSVMNSYFYRIPRLWNSIPVINLSYPLTTIKLKLKKYFWNHFINNFDSNNFCTFYYLCPCHKCTKTPAPTNYCTL